MKNIIKFLSIIAYLVFIFYQNSIVVLILHIFVSLIIILLKKLDLVSLLKNIMLLLPFIFLNFMINSVIVDCKYALIIGIRLILACIISFMFSKILTIKETAIVIQKLLTPLKVLKIDNEEIGLIIFIALSIVPNIINELQQKMVSIRSKTVRMNLRNILIIIKSIMVSMIIKVGEYEDSLVSKGYSNK